MSTGLLVSARLYYNILFLQSLFSLQVGIPVRQSLLPVPSETPGDEQTATVSVPMANSVFYYALVAVDAAGNRGQVSNLVPVFIPVQEEEEQDEFEFRSEPDHFSTQVTTLINRLSKVKKNTP